MTMVAANASAVRAEPPCAAEHTHRRTGYSDQIAPWAKPAISPKESGGYVGGSCLRRGEGRIPETDGTWGWDYVGGRCWPQRVFLGWCHEQCRRPAPGTYRTDGRHIPDL